MSFMGQILLNDEIDESHLVHLSGGFKGERHKGVDDTINMTLTK